MRYTICILIFIMRTLKVHSKNSVKFTDHAQKLCHLTNTFMRQNPNSSIAMMARHIRENENIKLSEVSLRRYYYGVHHLNEYPRAYSQVRLGASFPINY